MSDISKIKINDTTYDIKDPTARTNAASALNNKVSKSGDTMTGGLNVQGVLNAVSINCDSTDTSSSSSVWYKAVGCLDANNKYVGYIQPIMYDNGSIVTRFGARKTINNASYDNVLELCVSKDGNPIVQFSNLNAWLSALNLSDSGWKTLNSTVTTYYRKRSGIVEVIMPARNVNQGSFTLGTLPTGYRPKYTIWGVPTVSMNGSAAATLNLSVTDAGVVTGNNASGYNPGWMFGFVIFIAEG